jgi:hypothetical protein
MGKVVDRGESEGLGKEVSMEYCWRKVRTGCASVSLSLSSIVLIIDRESSQLVGNNGNRRVRHRSKSLHVLLPKGTFAARSLQNIPCPTY